MTNLEVIVFEVKNNKPIVLTGQTTAHGPPTTIDSITNSKAETLSYKNGILMATVTRPLSLISPRNNNLSGCSQWNVSWRKSVAWARL
ncbi:unnamed protein product, partial [Mesorhabditis belari]|uniref:DOMON domain-containing protein n=1 Tax=Mesorhabditis belari TaxID=2138241 RepID=A0AAF3JA28_9BILA